MRDILALWSQANISLLPFGIPPDSTEFYGYIADDMTIITLLWSPSVNSLKYTLNAMVILTMKMRRQKIIASVSVNRNYLILIFF